MASGPSGEGLVGSEKRAAKNTCMPSRAKD